MIGAAVSLLEDGATLVKALSDLAIRHSKIGVRSHQYGIVGEVLLWSLETCLGPEIFDAATKLAWVKIYSFMLKAIIPVAIAEERKIIARAERSGERDDADEESKSMSIR